MERRLELIAEMTPAIWVHLIAVFAAVFIGAYVLLRPKGTASHKFWGRIWVALMGVGTLATFFIMEIRDGFSPIHLLSIYSLCSLVIAMVAIRSTAKRIKLHGGSLMSLYYSGLMIAGGFTFLPDRLLGRLTFGEWLPWINFGIVAVMAGFGGLMLVRSKRKV